MKRRIIKIAAVSVAFISSLCTYGQSLQAAAEAVTADPALGEAVMSICAIKGDGKVLVDIDADNMVIPASNMKLITTGAALHFFGPDHHFET